MASASPGFWSKAAALLKALRRRLAPFAPLLEAKEKADHLAGLFDQALATATSHRLASSNEDVNRLYAVGSTLANHLRRFADRPPRYWIEHSGANLFSYADTTTAVARLVAMRENVDGILRAAEALSSLTKAITGADYADVKGVAGALTTATIADVYARQETWQTFDLCSHHCERLQRNVSTAIDAVRDLESALHTFLVRKNNPRRFQDTLARHSPLFKPGPVPELQVNPWKRAAAR